MRKLIIYKNSVGRVFLKKEQLELRIFFSSNQIKLTGRIFYFIF